VVHQEIHQWYKFGESITVNSKDITIFHKAGQNYGHMPPDLSGHKNDYIFLYNTEISYHELNDV